MNSRSRELTGPMVYEKMGFICSRGGWPVKRLWLCKPHIPEKFRLLDLPGGNVHPSDALSCLMVSSVLLLSKYFASRFLAEQLNRVFMSTKGGLPSAFSEIGLFEDPRNCRD